MLFSSENMVRQILSVIINEPYLPLDPSLKLGQAGVQLVDGNMNSNDLNPSIV